MLKKMLALASLPLLAANPNLANIRSVYLLPMTNGMDQYLANHLIEGQVVTVTTNPQTADAILTDSLGPAFEHRLDELYPPPEPPEEKAKDDEKKDSSKDEPKELVRGAGANFRFSAFRKGRGMVFLVDRRSKQVIWSVHELPKDASAKQIDRTAARMTEKLKKDYAGK